MGGRVAIAATGPVSLAAGREVALAGGNAVDVAVAAALAAMSTEPGIVSLAGGAFVSVWPAAGDPVVIDGNVEMPGRGPARRALRRRRATRCVTDYGGGVRMFAGHGSVATPGAVTACELAVEELGALSWADVVAPATRACRDGYPIGGGGRALPRLHGALALRPRPRRLPGRDPGRRVGGRAGRRDDQPGAGRRARPGRPRRRLGAHHRRDRPGDGRRHGRARWPGDAPRPRRVHAAGAAAGAPHRRASGTSRSTRRRRWAARCSP